MHKIGMKMTKHSTTQYMKNIVNFLVVSYITSDPFELRSRIFFIYAINSLDIFMVGAIYS